jgi:hypothetical protein
LAVHPTKPEIIIKCLTSIQLSKRYRNENLLIDKVFKL